MLNSDMNMQLNEGLILGFKLSHEEGTNSVFYKKRDFEEDINVIYDSLRYDTLFINHSCELIKDFDNHAFYFKVKNFALSHDTAKLTQKYIFIAIENKLAILGLYNHFYIHHDTIPITIHETDTILAFTPNFDALEAKIQTSQNHRDLEEVGFPLRKIPSAYCCGISFTIMDIPEYDPNFDEQSFDTASILRILRNRQPNPFTQIPIRYSFVNYALWDKISNFMDKIKFIYSQKLDFQEYMNEILNENFSCEELRHQLEGEISLSDNLITEIEQAFTDYRYTLTEYLCERQLASETDFTKESNQFALFYKILSQYKQNKNDETEFNFQILQDSSFPKTGLEWACVLVYKAQYSLQQECWKEAGKLANNAEMLFQNYTNNLSHLHADFDYQLSKQIRLLAKFHCSNTSSGRYQAIRRATVYGTETELQECLEELHANPNAKDTNPEKGYTALHLALHNSDIQKAWLLEKSGASLDISSAYTSSSNNLGNSKGGETSLDLIKKSDIPEIKALASPYISFTITPLVDDGAIIARHMPNLLDCLGFPDDSVAIYLPGIKEIVLAPCQLNSSILTNAFFYYCIQMLESDPTLCNLFRINSIKERAEQPSLLVEDEMVFRINFNKDQWNRHYNNVIYQASNNYVMNMRNINTMFASTITLDVGSIKREYARNCVDLIFYLLGNEHLNLLFSNKTNVNFKIDNEAPEVTICFSCKTSPYLQKFLEHYIPAKMKTHSRFSEMYDSVEIIESIKEIPRPTIPTMGNV